MLGLELECYSGVHAVATAIRLLRSISEVVSPVRTQCCCRMEELTRRIRPPPGEFVLLRPHFVPLRVKNGLLKVVFALFPPHFELSRRHLELVRPHFELVRPHFELVWRHVELVRRRIIACG